MWGAKDNLLSSNSMLPDCRGKQKLCPYIRHVYLHFSSAALVLSVFGLRFPAIKLLENQPNTSILMYIE